jgi:hypothetical protein
MEYTEISEKTYAEQLDENKKALENQLRNKFPDINDFEKVQEKIYDYEDALQNVYMELGMRCGFKLTFQFLSDMKLPSGIEKRSKEYHLPICAFYITAGSPIRYCTFKSIIFREPERRYKK